MKDGLYKVDFHTVHGTGSGVVYATGGKIRGGNSGFAFIGNYSGKGEEITREGHNPAAQSRSEFETFVRHRFGDVDVEGIRCSGDMIDFEGTALQLPGVNFKAVLTRISD